MNLHSLKTQLILFLIAFALTISIREGDSLFVIVLLIGVASALFAELIASLLYGKKPVRLESSIITGLIVGFVLGSGDPWWVVASASLFAIASKYCIRLRKKHLFNPAAFGLLAVSLLFRSEMQWQGTYYWYILVPAGVYFATKIRRRALVASYSATVFVFYEAQALFSGGEFGRSMEYLIYFYVFIMILEPKTTPFSTKGGIVFGIVLALLFIASFEIRSIKEVELITLLVMNAGAASASALLYHKRKQGEGV